LSKKLITLGILTASAVTVIVNFEGVVLGSKKAYKYANKFKKAKDEHTYDKLTKDDVAWG